jgi:hypothetical protein
MVNRIGARGNIIYTESEKRKQNPSHVKQNRKKDIEVRQNLSNPSQKKRKRKKYNPGHVKQNRKKGKKI